MRKHIAVWVILLFSLNLLAYSGTLDEGLQFLRQARKARANENEKEELEYLAKAFEKFQATHDSDSLLLLSFTGSKLHKENETNPVFVDFIKQDRRGYLDKITHCPYLLSDEKEVVKNSMLVIENSIPYIGDIGINPKSIYPYRDQQAGITFNLNANAQCNLSMNGLALVNQKLSRGENEMKWPWSDGYLNLESLGIALDSRNDMSTDSKKITVKLIKSIPENLVFENYSFGIKGKTFLEESKRKYKKEKSGFAKWAVGFGGIFGSLGALATVIDNKDTRSSNLIITGVCATILLVGLFMPKKETSEYQIVTIEKNRIYNEELNKEIEAKKAEVKVEMEVELN